MKMLAVTQHFNMLIVADCSWRASCHDGHNAAFAMKRLLGIIRIVENSHYAYIYIKKAT